jgi:signal transduction histidine kinase
VTRRLLLTYLLLTAVVLAVLEIPLAVTFKSREESRFLSAVERDARVIAAQVEDLLEQGTGYDPAPMVQEYKDTIGGRAVVVDRNGRSIADSDNPDGVPRDFSTRAEIAAALDGKVSSGIRSSETLGTRLIYVAVPVASSGQVHGAVRITYPASELDRRVRNDWLNLALLAATILVGVAVAGWLLARGVTRPVAQLRAATTRLAAGDLDARADSTTGPPEVRGLSRDFDEMADRLGELVGAQRAFVADASHQLRTPLTALRLRLESLDEPADDRDRDQLDAAIEETHRLQRLVDALLTLARADAATMPLAEVDAAQIARERCLTWSPLAEERSVDLHYGGPATATATAVDGVLEQILDELIANALDVSPDGTTITVTVTKESTGLTLTVDDQGPGMTDEQLRRAKDRFWRAPDAPAGGTGLGLAIIEQLARQSGGTLHLGRSTDQGGLRASVTLPAGTTPKRALG